MPWGSDIHLGLSVHLILVQSLLQHPASRVDCMRWQFRNFKLKFLIIFVIHISLIICFQKLFKYILFKYTIHFKVICQFNNMATNNLFLMAKKAIELSLQGHMPVSASLTRTLANEFNTAVDQGGCIIREAETVFRNGFEILEDSLMRQHLLITFPDQYTPEMLSLPMENDRSETSWAEFQHILQLWKSMDLSFLSELQAGALEDIEFYLDLKTSNKVIEHSEECLHTIRYSWHEEVTLL